MKNYILILFTTLAFGQKPFSKQNTYNTFAVKGIAYFNLLDGGYGGVFGFEKGFAKQHSIGLKYSYDLATPHTENTTDGSNDPINYSHNKNQSFILEYKYYFDFKFLSKYTMSPYVYLSYKFGKKTLENDRDYPHDFYYREIKYNILGPGIGTLISLDDSKTWTVDTQISYLMGQKNIMTEGISNSKSSMMDKLRFEILVAYNLDW